MEKERYEMAKEIYTTLDAVIEELGALKSKGIDYLLSTMNTGGLDMDVRRALYAIDMITGIAGNARLDLNDIVFGK